MHAVITLGGQPVETEEEDEADTIKPLPDRLVSELTAHRTLALGRAGRQPACRHDGTAAPAGHGLLHAAFQSRLPEAQVRKVDLPAQAEDLRDSASAKAIADRHERWGDHVPGRRCRLWDWLTDLDDGSRMDLLAHCVSYGINALYEKPNPSGTGVSQHGLTSACHKLIGWPVRPASTWWSGWRPTVGNYLGRVTAAYP